MGRRKGSLNKKTIEKNKKYLSHSKQKPTANGNNKKYSTDQLENDVAEELQQQYSSNDHSPGSGNTRYNKTQYNGEKSNNTSLIKNKTESLIINGSIAGIQYPAAVDLEEAILGAVMLEKNAYTQIAHLIPTHEIFYDLKHQRIWEAVMILGNDGSPIDILTVTNQLKKLKTLDLVGGPFFVSQLTSRVGSAANIEYHTAIIIEKFIKRNIISSSIKNFQDAQDDEIDVFALIEACQDRMMKPIEKVLNHKNTSVFPMFMDYMAYLEKVWEHDGKLLGIPSGLPDLDELTGGWQEPNFIIVAGRPGMGKTATALALARNACGIAKKKVGILSLEMGSLELIGRLISMETGIPVKQLKSGKGVPKNIFHTLHQIPDIYKENLHIDDTGEVDLAQLRIKIKQMKQKYKLDLIIIDYIQLVSPAVVRKGGTKAEEVDSVAKGIKKIAKAVNIPIIGLAQLNRKVEERPLRRPMLSDLKESGGLEEAADIAILLYRPDYYKIQTIVTSDGKEILGEGKILFDIVKHRDGPVGELLFDFDGKCTMVYQDGFKYDLVTPAPPDKDEPVKNSEEIEKVPTRYIKNDIFKSVKSEPKGFLGKHKPPDGTEYGDF